ncbi:MAG: hypothetical protein DWQ37_05045 [Planctomycetota bacterium]|nr:MAG: hypothetical protein DWQ37_05045 [Planctomycetota bacterium]
MSRTLSFAAAPVVWLLSAAALFAQADPLTVIPDDVLGFAVISDLTDTNERITTLTQKMQIPVPDVLSMAKGYLGVDKGLDEKGGLAFALMAGPEGKEVEGLAPFVIAPVTDYAAFIAPLSPEDPDAAITKATVFGSEVLVGKKDDFAVFMLDVSNKDALETFLAADTSVSSQVEPLKKWMGQQQLSVVVTPKGKSLLFQKLAEAMPDAEDLDADADDEDASEAEAAALASVGQMFGMFKQLLTAADEQLTHLAAGIRIEDDATLHVAARALFVPEGDLAQWSKKVKAPSEGLLAGVPAGDYVLAYGGVSAHFSPAVWNAISQLSDSGMQMMGLNDEDRKKYMQIGEKLQKGKRYTGGVLSMMRPGDSIFSTAVTVEHVDNADEQVRLSREMFAMLADGAKTPGNDEPMYELSEVKVGDVEAIALVTRIDALAEIQDGNAPGAEQFQDFFGKLFGGGNLTVYMAKATDTTVVSAYSKEQLLRGVEHVRSGAKGLESDADIAKTSAMLPAGSQWAAYLNPQGVVQMIQTFMDALLGGQVQLPPFPETEPIGLAARVSETGLDAEIVLPESVVAGIGQFIFAVGQMFQGGQVPLP